MSKTVIGALVLVVIILAGVSVLINQKLLSTSVINSDGDWKVTGTTVSGAVGDTVPIDFSLALISDRCAKMDVYIETVDEARQKIEFVGAAVPAASASVSAERVEWAPTEFENSVVNKYRVNARIAHGTPGDEINDFYLSAWCDSSPNAGVYFGIADNIKVKIIAKATATKKPTATPVAKKTTPTPIVKKVTPTPRLKAIPQNAVVVSPNLIPVSITERVPVSIKNEEQNDKASERTVDVPSEVVEKTSQSAPKPSFFGRAGKNFIEGFRAVGDWFAGLL